MRMYVVLSGLLWLVLSTHGLDNLLIDCSELWLQVKVRRIPLFDELQLQHYELYLGTGCSVNRILPDFFEFTYPLSSCGIVKYDQIWGTLIESSISYEPVILNFRGYVPISCSVQRKLRFTFIKKEVGNNDSHSRETTQGPLGKTNSTFSQVKNLKIQPETRLGNGALEFQAVFSDVRLVFLNHNKILQRRFKFSSVVPFGMNGYKVNTWTDSSQETKEGPQPLAFAQKPATYIYQLSCTHAHVKTSSLP